MIKYNPAVDIESRTWRIAQQLEFGHIDYLRVKCFRSTGSQSNAIARCYALGKIWQKALNTRAHYVIEVIAERFDRLPKEEQDKVLIHELLHIPKSFGGGFRHHDYVCKRTVETMHKKLTEAQ